jgi:type I restriction enzyme R subunit
MRTNALHLRKETERALRNLWELNCDCNKRQKIKVKLKDGKEREIQSMISTSFWSADGRPISAEEFLNNLFGELPNLFKSEDELRTLWSNPLTRRTL